jgi:hypothetical protein
LGTLPAEDFAIWYEILRSEGPLTVFYNTNGSGTITRISLSTADEPVGEGLADISS